MTAVDRIDYDDKGNLDDVVIHNVALVHLEYMTDNKVWIRLDREDGSAEVFWLEARGKIKGTHHHE